MARLKDFTVEEFKAKYNRIDPNNFIWEKFAVKNGVDLGARIIKVIKILGWTENKGLLVRPKYEGISLLFHCEEGEFWQHLTEAKGDEIYFDQHITNRWLRDLGEKL